MQKQRLESKFWHELAYAFWQNGLQKIYLTDAKNLRRWGPDKKSLELVHRDFFGRFTPGASFLQLQTIF